METLLYILLVLNLVILITIIFTNKNKNTIINLEPLNEGINRLEKAIKEECRYLLSEQNNCSRANREELSKALTEFRTETTQNLNRISEQNLQILNTIYKTLEENITKLTSSQENRLTLLVEKLEQTTRQSREEMAKSFKEFEQSFSVSVSNFSALQKDKFAEMEKKQKELIESTEKRLDEMRTTVDEKLQKTLNERIGQSFEMVSKKLEDVQKGLGEMQNLAQDVGGLKKVLSNVKMRGGIGEVQLEMLLEQVLAPDQYESNVKTKKDSKDFVEFAIKLPGKDDTNKCIYLPVDAKFPKDVYEQLLYAHEQGETSLIDAASKNIEQTIKAMAKDIRDKYLDPPFTTDFGIMFLPFESIYGEVVRRAKLLEQLQREYKVIVTGPTTLAAILNSLQMGFRTLAIQKRSSEVWRILGAVKTEFEKFGGMLEKAQKSIQTANTHIEQVMGPRTRAIQRQLRNVEALPIGESEALLTDGEEFLEN
ncbi:MAG: DNA recombination protein RmuC [Odoribacter sp.]|nr:DNA recombination protein RmuC [Odoribacter sp.]